jgi:metallophosphoesterase superfamily enzyme
MLEHNGIQLTHEPLQNVDADKFNIAGHVHPGTILKGRGRQSIKLPCFWMYKNQLIMPAFGNLTGAVRMPKVKATVYAVFENELLEL